MREIEEERLERGGERDCKLSGRPGRKGRFQEKGANCSISRNGSREKELLTWRNIYRHNYTDKNDALY